MTDATKTRLPLLLFAVLAPLTLHAQVTLSTVASDGTETAVPPVFGFGQAAAGDVKTIQFRARNSGGALMSISTLSLTAPGSAGLAFSILNPPALPYSLNAGGTLDFSVQFSAATVSGYSATLLVNSQSYILLGSVVGAPLLNVGAPCAGPDANGVITFNGGSCSITLLNPAAQAFPVSPVTLTGAGFSGVPASYANGVTLPASQSVSFTLNYSGNSGGTGTLTIATRTYTLQGTPASIGAISSLTLSVIAGDGSGTETILGSPAAYDFGQVAEGDAKIVHFRARNNGSTAVTITTLSASNVACAAVAPTGFSIVTTSCPNITVAPGSFVEIFVQFSAITPNVYNGNLTVNSQTISLQATAVPAATLQIGNPSNCTYIAATATINFGRTQVGNSVTCQFTFVNPNDSALNLSSSIRNSNGSADTQNFSGLPASITIPANQSTPITVTFTPQSSTGSCDVTGLYNICDTMFIGARSYNLIGAGFSAPLAKPNLTFDTQVINSGEQHSLTITLSSPSTVSFSSGILTMSFKSQSSTVTDDSAIQFVKTSKRLASFAVTAGSMAVTINGQPSIDFQTGTTAGQITFTLSDGIYGFAGDPTTTVTLAPLPISITSTPTAVRKLGALAISASGFDNTYSAGPMSFTFYDLAGKMIGSPINADFTKNFQALDQGGLGSSFLMGVTFPVTGDQSQVGSADVTLTNSAGTVKVSKLTFQ